MTETYGNGGGFELKIQTSSGTGEDELYVLNPDTGVVVFVSGIDHGEQEEIEQLFWDIHDYLGPLKKEDYVGALGEEVDTDKAAYVLEQLDLEEDEEGFLV